MLTNRISMCRGLPAHKLIICSQCLRPLSTTSHLFKKKSKLRRQPAETYDIITIPGDKKDISVPLPKSYSSKFTEAVWYDWWIKQGYFQPSTAEDKFVMILPPPNVTGKLHIGHAFTSAIQDAIIRWNRMSGRSTLWLPGLDHAGIATQVVVEKKLWREERLTRHDIGKHAFLRHVWDWKHKMAEEITTQLKRLGLSLDWSRETFTMDDGIREAVSHAFCQLHSQGLISRRTRVVNWSCELKSAIADIEVDVTHIEGPTNFKVPGYSQEVTLGYLTSFAYPVHESESGEEIVVSTTRLETLLGDTAIVVHPDDERYKHLVGTKAIHPFTDRLLPIIADDFVQTDLGTGAVKLTPSHSSIDHEVALRHSLRAINILNDDGTLCNCGQMFDGMKRFDAREKVAQQLQKKGLWRGQQPHAMAVPLCSRSYDIIEPRLKEQWFIDCSEMAEEAIKAADDGRLHFIPPYYKKLWSHNLTKTKEISWCVSRQLWWGHNIPAYRLYDNNKFVQWLVAPSLPEAITKARQLLGHDQFRLEQDEDVLDTWFSSALLPFAALGWPTRNSDLMTFYPGSAIESGSDILFFWIARMVMLGQKLTSKLPFNQVLIHSLVLSQGKKMSKSKGNVVDPLSIIDGSTLTELEKSLESSNMDRKDMAEALAEQKRQFADGIPECGADALRMALCSYDFKGQAVNIDVSTFIEYTTLCNKIWQIYQYYRKQAGEEFIASDLCQLELNSSDRWMLNRCAQLVDVCASHFPLADLDIIVKKLESFWVNDISRHYLEFSKSTLLDGSEAERHTSLSVAFHVMDVGLRCLSPFMPFLSEELYQRLPLPDKFQSICIASFPSAEEWSRYADKVADGHFSEMLSIANQVNYFKSAFGLMHRSKAVGKVHVMNGPTRPIPGDILHHMGAYCRLKSVHLDTLPDDFDLLCPVELGDTSACSVFIDLSESLQERDAEELSKMSSKLHNLLKSERQLLDQCVHLDVAELTNEQLSRHQAKVESMKKEVMQAEKCVNYLLAIIDRQTNSTP